MSEFNAISFMHTAEFQLGHMKKARYFCFQNNWTAFVRDNMKSNCSNIFGYDFPKMLLLTCKSYGRPSVTTHFWLLWTGPVPVGFNSPLLGPLRLPRFPRIQGWWWWCLLSQCPHATRARWLSGTHLMQSLAVLSSSPGVLPVYTGGVMISPSHTLHLKVGCHFFTLTRFHERIIN